MPVERAAFLVAASYRLGHRPGCAPSSLGIGSVLPEDVRHP